MRLKLLPLLLVVAFILPQNVFAQERSFDERINESMTPATAVVTDIIFFPITLAGDGEIEGYTDEWYAGLSEQDQITFHHDNGETKTYTKAEFETFLAENSLNIKTGSVFGDGGSTFTYSIPFVLIWLLVGAMFFTVYMGFINFRGIKLSYNIVKGRYTSPDDPGEVSHFQALTAALSGTVGLGNIAGVAIAIATGGPGATFWMILAGLLGMSSKFVECTLGVKYRSIAPDGEVSGGPMYYLSRGLAEKGKNWKKVGAVLAGFFAIMCIGGSFGGGNMFQVNQAAQQFVDITGGESSFFADKGWLFGFIVAALVAVVIIGGIKSIAKVTDKIVPIMCGIYVIASLIVIFGNFTAIPEAFGLILEGAFAPKAALGGVIGVMIVGFQRAAFSNEAGVGSAAIAHSAVKTSIPVTEGFVALLEPFIDTVVVCTMTALVIIITGMYANPDGLDGISLTSSAFTQVIPWFGYVLAIAVILFAFSTMISWSYYGLKAWTYLFGDSKVSEVSYKVIFCLFVVLGASMSLGAVTDFSDAMIFAMCFPNVFGLYVMSRMVKKDLINFKKGVKTGEIKTYK